MKIKKSDLKILIENFLLENKESSTTSFASMNYIPTKAFAPVVVGKSMTKDPPKVEGSYLGMKDGYGGIEMMYILIDEDEKQNISKLLKIGYGGSNVYKKLKIQDIEEVVEAVNASGFSIRRDKIEQYVRESRVVRIMNTNPDNYVYEPLSTDETAGRHFLKTTAIESVAALGDVGAAIATSLGAIPVAAAFNALGNVANVADLFVKIDDDDYLGCVFAIIGLIPGGDSLGIMKKLGLLEDMPDSAKKQLGEAILNIIDGDFRKTTEELVKAYKEDRVIAEEDTGQIITNIMNAATSVGKFMANNPDAFVA